MENNENINTPLSSTTNSGNEIKTVYINDIESLNDSTENFYLQKNEKINNNINKGKNNSKNYDLNKNENQSIKNNSLNKISKIKDVKEKIQKNTKKINNSLNKNKDSKKEKKGNNNFQKFKLIPHNYLDEIDKIKINKLINRSNISGNKLDKNEIEKYITDNEIKLANKPGIIKKNNSLKLVLMKENEKERIKEINFLKKEIQLKNSIIQKLIEENKNLIEKINMKEVELLNYKNKEENLTKVIQDNNICISNLNELILRLVQKYENNKEIINSKALSKSRIEKKNVENIINSKILNNGIKNQKNIKNKNCNIYNNIMNKEIFNNNSVQRYFKIHTRNNIKKHLDENNLLDINRTNDNNRMKYINKKDKYRRNNAISIDFTMLNNNHSDFINETINFTNNNLMKSSTKSNLINKPKNKKNIFFNLDFEEDNKSDVTAKYFTGNISCKNEIINKNLDIPPKKCEYNNKISSNDIFSFSNINNKYKKFSSPQQKYNKDKINIDIDKSYNLKYFKNFNFIQNEKQNFLEPKINNNDKILNFFNNEGSFSVINNNNNNIKFPLNSDYFLKEKHNNFSTRNLGYKANQYKKI